MPAVKVYIIRHGETDENVQGIIQGQLDTSLNDLGRQQAERVAEVLESMPFKAAWTSDLKRAVDTANAIVVLHPGLTVDATPLLRERYLAGLEGTLASNRKAGYLPKDAESGTALADRCLKFWDTFILPLATSDPGEISVFAVSHGAYISTLIRAALASRDYGVTGQFGGPLYNSSVTVVQVHAGGQSGEVLKYGDISHLLKPSKAKKNVDVLGNEDKTEVKVVSE